jgi:hypothetical protein
VSAALTAVSFALFAISLMVLALGVSLVSAARALGPARQAAGSAALDEQYTASLAVCEGLEQAAGARNPLELAQASAMRMSAALASRLGDRHPAVAWCDEIARRLGGIDELERRMEGRPRQFLMRLDELEEARTLARLVGSCLRLREEYADARRPEQSSRLGTVPLGIVEDFIAAALRWGDLVITLVPAKRSLAR